MDGPVELGGHLGHGQTVEVAERERGPVMGAELGEHAVGTSRVDVGVPGIVDGRFGPTGGEAQLALVEVLQAPVVGELVAGDADEPGGAQRRGAVPPGGVHRGEVRLRREVLGRSRYALDNMEIVDCVYGVFNSAYDAELFSLGSSGLTFIRTRIPITMPNSRALPTFEGPTDYRDTLPPATVITRVVKSPSGALIVEGTTSDDQTVQTVLVNDQEAKATGANFAQWKISLDGPWNNEAKLTAHAVDDFGNTEPKPHALLIRLP